LPDPVIPDFEKATGIKVNSTPFSQNEEQINKLQATDGVGFDLCQPTHDRAPQFRDIGVLQPLDDKRVKLDLIVPSLLKASIANWTWDGKLYHVPHCWGTEAIAWRNDQTKIAPADLSFGTLWNDEYKGKVQGRPHSLLLGIGLWLDGTGKLPTNRMLDAYKNEDQMKKIYDVLLKEAIDRKAWIKQFWDSADNTKSGFLSNGVVIGQTWDGPVISLKKSGKPISFQAPKEGAIGWVDGWALSKASKNLDQAYAFLNYLHSPEGAAKVAEGSGYNPSGIGADKLLSDKARSVFEEAYPGASIEAMWWRPVEPSWFAELRSQYAEKYKAA
jgi:spermidine/putrescine transport system substrate-binding protein